MFSAVSSGKIFRPWDVSNMNQDLTITSTTEISTSNQQNFQKHEIKEEPREDYLQPPCHLSEAVSQLPSLEALYNYSTSSFASTSTLSSSSFLHPHLSLQQDPLLLQGLPSDLLLSQNYALEEYARILTQDHQTKMMNSRKQRPKKYKCPHCDVGFSNNGQLKGHIRIHTGERPFKCDDPNCGKTFTRNEELTRHKRIHSGLRPFSCTQCGKRFGRKDHLKKHSRTHMQPKSGVYAVPVMFPLDTWTAGGYPYMAQIPMMY